VAVLPGQLRYHAAYTKAVERVAEQKAVG
jgi:hypothetical protein